jgi:hypothetical protein
VADPRPRGPSRCAFRQPAQRSARRTGRVVAEYYGPFGSVEGTITSADGETVRLDGFFGMGEQKRIRM